MSVKGLIVYTRRDAIYTSLLVFPVLGFYYLDHHFLKTNDEELFKIVYLFVLLVEIAILVWKGTQTYDYSKLIAYYQLFFIIMLWKLLIHWGWVLYDQLIFMLYHIVCLIFLQNPQLHP